MTAEQFRERLEHLGLSRREAAKALGVSIRTIDRWREIDGDCPITNKYALRVHQLLIEKCERDGTEPPKPLLIIRDKLDKWEELEVYQAMDSGSTTVALAPRPRTMPKAARS